MHRDALLRPAIHILEEVHVILGRAMYGRHTPPRFLCNILVTYCARGQVGLKDVPATQVSPCVGRLACRVYMCDLMVGSAHQ